MTCYEALRCEARGAPGALGPPGAQRAGAGASPAGGAPMAHHLLKWWRNKFRGGYKKFHLGTDGERTDTEELVGRAASQCSAPPDLLPSEARALLQPASPEPRHRPRTPPSPATTYSPRAPRTPHAIPLTPIVVQHAPHSPADTPHVKNVQHDKPPRLRFEELTCDVQVQHDAPSKQQPLQFSFTLYDLDGHGRMTKDDIAGIVSTIYESVGKSVTVPHYGSKTIQVKLTVVPESPVSPAPAPTTAPERKVRRDGRRRPRRRKETMAAAAPDCGDATDDERRSRLSVDDDVSSCSGERRRRVRTRSTRTQSGPLSASRSQAHKDSRERRPSKKRSGSLQRRELLEIIQANMEKNHLSFQTSRKPHEKVINEEENIINNNNNNNTNDNNKHHRHRNRAFSVSAKPTADTFHNVKSQHPGNGYLDLAQTHEPISNTSMDSNLCRYDRYLHAVICSSTKHANSGYHQKILPNTPLKPQKAARTHHRSRSHDVPPRFGQVEPRVLQIIFL